MSLTANIKNLISKAKQNPVLNVVLNKYFLVTLLFVIIILVDSNSIFVWFRSRSRLRSQYEQIEYYNNEIKATESKINELASQKDSLEKFAREEYFYHENDEDVFIVE